DHRTSAESLSALGSSSLVTWDETPSHHRVRTSLEFITLRTQKNVITIPKPPLLQPSRPSPETAFGHLFNDQGNA
ncbi:hypothetical protein M9458_057948, partial [Cirrhinus mrigala]